MNKKTTISIIAVLVCSLIVSSTVLAADGPLEAGARVAYGEVSALGADTITIATPQGEDLTFQVDENTRFRAPMIDSATFGDLEVGSKVAVYSRSSTDLASVVVILPEEFDPSQWASVRARGEISAIDLEANTFTIRDNAGEQKTFLVDEITRYYGQVTDLGAMQIGLVVGVAGVETESGNLMARLIIAVDVENTSTKGGTLSVVDPLAGTFTLLTRQDETLTFVTDENTIFYSRDENIHDLADLEPEMVAMVVSVAQSDGTFLARRVAAGSADDLPNFDIKAGGTVTAVDAQANTITIQTQGGEDLTFSVDGETRFRGQGVVNGIADVAEGMILLFGAYDSSSERPVASLVIVRQAQTP